MNSVRLGPFKGETNLSMENEEDYLIKYLGKLLSTIINNLNIIEILSVTPITNTKLERTFNCMQRVKND